MTAIPAETPDTTPAALTVATDVADDVQLPPDAVSVNVVVLPAHKMAVPVIWPADIGTGVMVISVSYVVVQALL